MTNTTAATIKEETQSNVNFIRNLFGDPPLPLSEVI